MRWTTIWMFTRRESASTKQERGHHMDVPPGENQQVPNKRGAIIMDVPLGENQQVLNIRGAAVTMYHSEKISRY
jgi:hypothetical protein